MWDNLKYFLEQVVPVAEEYDVNLAAHPDDPPISPIRGIARVLISIENYQKLIDLVPSPVNGVGLCQGNFTLMTDDLPGAIRHFGAQNKIFFVHFRDVRRNAGEVRGDVPRRWQDRHAGLHASLPRGWLRGRLPSGPRAHDGGR